MYAQMKLTPCGLPVNVSVDVENGPKHQPQAPSWTEKDTSMTSSEKHDCLEALYEELFAIQHTMSISRCWAGNDIACRNLDRREAEICRAINSIR